MISAWLLLLLNTLCFPLRLGNAGSFPRPLKAEEEREYLARCAQGDLEARNKLVEHNLRLVSHILKKYYVQAADQDDLISIGTIGLIKGISTFKPDKKVRLATYASRCIENEILMYFRSQRKYQGEVSLSDSLDSCQKVRRCVDRCLSDREAKVITLRYGLDGQEPQTQREIAAACGISRSYVSRLEKKALEKLRQEMERGN